MPSPLVLELARLLEAQLAGGVVAEGPAQVRIVGDEAWLGIHDGWLTRVSEAGGAARVAFRPVDGGPWRDVEVPSVDALEDHLEAIVASAAAWSRRLTVYRLRPGVRYRVVRGFEDFFGQSVEAGEILTFVSRGFLPYDDGHTLRFEERTVQLQGGTQVYADFGLLLVEEG